VKFLGLDNFSSCDRIDISSNSGADGLTDSFRSSSDENIPAGDPDSGSPSILDLATAPLGSSSGTNAVPNPSSFPSFRLHSWSNNPIRGIPSAAGG